MLSGPIICTFTVDVAVSPWQTQPRGGRVLRVVPTYPEGKKTNEYNIIPTAKTANANKKIFLEFIAVFYVLLQIYLNIEK
jgi:hypothetical protein